MIINHSNKKVSWQPSFFNSIYNLDPLFGLFGRIVTIISITVGLVLFSYMMAQPPQQVAQTRPESAQPAEDKVCDDPTLEEHYNDPALEVHQKKDDIPMYVLVALLFVVCLSGACYVLKKQESRQMTAPEEIG